MRATFTFLLLAFFAVTAWAQPANDECATATALTLNPPAACPGTSPGTSTFSFDNNNATATTPYPTFSGCTPGGMTDGPAAEVWFNFTAQSNLIEISVLNGLSTPNIVLFTGSDCLFLNPVACASAAQGAGSVTLNENVVPGEDYFILISGGDINDQGVFDLEIVSANDCDPCLLDSDFTASPPPQNGTYSSSTFTNPNTVNFCYIVNQWDLTGTIEWLHAVEISLGSGWDASTLTPTVFPQNCPAGGQWGFYDSWTSCNTGQTFGPGFAYESGLGVGCNGSPFDGNPGNNWGYGGDGCENIGTASPPLQFCFSVAVATCPPNSNGADLSVSVNPLSDGDSGSWNQTGCNSGTTFTFLASAVCCDDPPPIAIPINASCAQATDGSIQYQGGLPGETYNLFVFNQGGVQIANQQGVPGSQIFNLNNLAPGIYTVVASNVVSGCNKQIDVVVGADPPPTVTASNTGPYCPGQTIQLSTDYPPGPGVTYSWTGPNGFTSSDPNPTIPNAQTNNGGTYSVSLNINGCPADASTTVQVENVSVQAGAMPDEICAGETATLTVTGNANTYDWGPLGQGTTVITPPLATTTTFTVTGTTATGCTATDEVTVTVNPTPNLQIQQPPPACEGQLLVLQATQGLQNYQWNTGDNGPVIVVTPTNFTETYSVSAEDPVTGCPAFAEITINVNPQPDGMVTPGTSTICQGETVTLTASGGNNYVWSDNMSGAVRDLSPASSTVYTVTITDVAGCRDTVEASVFVDEPLPPPVITCGPNTPSSVEFNWDPVPGASGYSVEVVTGQTGTLNGTTFTVDGLDPSEAVTITVTAQSDNECPDSEATFTCTAQDCTPIDVAIDSVGHFCLYPDVEPDTLSVTVTGGSGGSGEWSGPGVVDSLLGVFDPLVADTGVNAVVYTYTEGICDYRDTVFIDVFVAPTADFSLDTNLVCINDSVFVSYTGSADTSAAFNWDFGGGTADPDTIPEQYYVHWATGGPQIISLTVEENGCLSEVFADTVDVQEPLPPPAITCGTATTTSVEFNWDPVPGATGYTVDVLTGQSGTLSGTTYTVDNLQPGEAVTIQVTVETDSPCGPSTAEATCNAADCPTFTIAVDPVDDVCLDGSDQSFDLAATVTGGDGTGALTWSGAGITDGAQGTFDPADAGVGAHVITATYTEGPCSDDQTLTINVFATPTADFTVAPDTLCVTGSVDVTYTGTASAGANYTWNFNGGTATPGTGPGPHTVSWAAAGPRTITLVVSENGCASPQFSRTVQVQSPLAPPVINCNTTTSEIVFTWNDVPGAVDYTVEVLSGQTGTQTGNSFTVSGLTPGEAVEIRVTAVGDGPCGDSFAEETCIAEDCPAVTIDFDPVDPICLDATAAPITLNATITGGAGGGTESWSGPGITDPATGEFDPAQASIGVHTLNLNYQEGNCTYNNSFQITVNEQPTADFTADTPICVDAASNVIYTGSASAGAGYAWDFDGGTATPGTGPGPHSVEWPAGGLYTVSLTVTENNCASEPFSLDVQVDEPLPAPVINCDPTTSSVTFTWADVPGATGYDVEVLSGPTGTQTGNSYAVTGLNPGDEVTIRVTALGDGACGDSFAELSCIAEDCPPATITFDPVDDICLDATAAPITLNATVTGTPGGGTESWSGPGVTDPDAGVFDPNAAGAGDHAVTFTYQEGNCTYNEQLTITVIQPPTADFTVDPNICADETATVTYTGTGGAGATFDWDFDGGTAPDAGPDPFEVSWADSGTRTISLTVTENGCASEPAEQTVQVDEPLTAPVVNCNTTNTSIEFVWNDVAGAASYEVNVLQGPAGVLSGTTYTVTGLNPGDEVTIEVVAVSGNVCADVSTEATCIALDCPAVTLTIDPVPDLCEDGDPVSLNATATGGAGGGSYEWSGPGVTDPVGTFDPAAAGSGTFTATVTYTEGVCTYAETVDIVVNPVPTADFTVTGPICVDETATVTYTGTAAANAIYDWDFAGGDAAGTGAGPYEVSWTASGDQVISLTVTENGCESEPFTQTVTVEDPLPAPVIDCETTSTSITFSWDPVPGAVDYQVNGPAGELTGTTYSLTGLSPGDEVTIEVIAVGEGACGNSSAEATCVAQDCPPLTIELDGPAAICAGSAATLTFSVNSSSDGPFLVSYLQNGIANELTIDATGTLEVSPTETTVFEIVSVTDQSLTDCVYPGNVSFELVVNQPVDAGTAEAPARVCEGDAAAVDLSALLTGADPGGQWTESSVQPSTGGAFDAAAGTFDPSAQSRGTYTFVYTLDAGDPCPDASAEVTVIVEATPVADAGPDQELTCNLSMVSLGGSATSTGAGITYQWTAADTSITIVNPDQPLIDASQAGVYTLTVTNDIGCSASDEVTVTSDFSVPVAALSFSGVSCFQSNDGFIRIDSVSGGTPPYQYSLNDGPFGAQTFYSGLSPDMYTLVIRDANGCISQLDIDLSDEPEELIVTLTTNLEGDPPVIERGDSLQLQAVFPRGVVLDTILWQPDSIGMGNATAVWVSPDETSVYSVTIIDENGCSDSDRTTVFVRKNLQVYIPNAFSPDGDGVNDVLFIQSSDKVREIKRFAVYNRWGESMVELENFLPNDPANGWDGTHRGQPMNAGVFVYHAEVEFEDGTVEVFAGDVLLVR